MKDKMAEDDVSCDDFGLFMQYLKNKRRIVDTIHIQLNKIENSPSDCEKIWQLLEEQHRLRKNALQKCLRHVDEELSKHGEIYTKQDTKKKIKSPKLEGEKMWIENELNVEDILRDHSLKVFRRKCSSYKPPNLS